MKLVNKKYLDDQVKVSKVSGKAGGSVGAHNFFAVDIGTHRYMLNNNENNSDT